MPLVSLVVAMRDEVRTIRPCITSIAGQHYPADRLEVWFFDGDSNDGTREIVAKEIAGRVRWHLRDNPRRIQAVAWNLGIDAATGEVIGILSGHAELGPDYVRAAVDALDRTGADMVGGPVQAVGEGLVGAAIALAQTTPFGVGGATFRYLDREADVDTVFMGICRAETYRRFRFDEAMVRNQDDELSYRILDAGGRIVCDPAIVSRYRARSTLRGLWRQYLDYGYWKVRVIRRHPRQLRSRHLVPAVFVGGLVLGGILSPSWMIGRFGTGLLAGAYVIADVGASVVVGRRHGPRTVAVLPLVFATMHVAYGVGMLAGVARAAIGVLGRPLAARQTLPATARPRENHPRPPAVGP